MNGPAVRSRLLGLRRAASAAREGRELLDRKREILLRELHQRAGQRETREHATAASLGTSRALIREARVELGRDTVESAALAQPPAPPLERHDGTLVGVRLPRLAMASSVFGPRYGPGGTCESLDRAGLAYSRLLREVVLLAQEDAAVRNLQRAQARTVRLLNALDTNVIPGLEREIRRVESVLEDEERDESFRRRRRTSARPWANGRSG
jgi:V/A-type H+-transporting ATPase subunit D